MIHTSLALCQGWLWEIKRREQSLGKRRKKKSFSMNRKGRKNITRRVDEVSQWRDQLEAQIEEYTALIKAKIGDYYPE